MKFYHFGDKEFPVILLLPGTCCYWKLNFGSVIPLLEKDLTALFSSIRYGYSLTDCKYIVLMLLGSILCFSFAGLIFKGFYRKKGEQHDEI